MANNVWTHPTWQATPQAKTWTITAVGGNTDVWTLTMTDDNGDTATVTYTNDGSPTLAEIATGLYDAWRNSTHPLINLLTASNPSSAVFKLTAKTSGVPFSVALTNGGTGTSSAVDTVANIGNNDGALDRNWSQNDAPDTGDDLIFEPGNVHWKYGLNFSGVTVGDIKVMKGCQSEFGRFDLGQFHYLRIAAGSFDFRGSGQLACFDLGSSNIPVYIESEGSTSANGRHVVYLKGSNLTTVEVVRGNVGLAVLDADTATVATVLCGLMDNPQSDVNMTIGSGVTLTTLTQSGGRCTMRCAATTVNVYPGSVLYTEGTGAITTVNVYAGGKFYPKSSGTITNLNLWGEADFTRDTTAKTVSNLNLKRGGKLVKHDSVTVSATTLPSSSGGAFDTLVAS